MWLWNKFKNTDIIGKIYILIILFIVVVATITIVTRYKNANTNQNVNEQNNQVNEVIEDTTTSEMDIEEENIVTVVNLDENKDVKTEKQEEIKNNVQTKNNSTAPKQEKVATSNSSSTDSLPNKTESEVTNESANEQIEVKEAKEEVKQNINESQNTREEQNTSKDTKENVVQEESSSVPSEEYKVNNTMINTMKNYIQNNPSESMRTYGFEVVVDSSIAEQTSQFTYSEQRMRDKINLRFGTIRIYALDYYYNGNLVMTECFIL